MSDLQSAGKAGALPMPMRPPPPIPPRPITPTPTSVSIGAASSMDVPQAGSRGSLPGAIERRNPSVTPPVTVEASAKQRLMYYSRVGVIPPPPAAASPGSGTTPVRSATDFAASSTERPRTSFVVGEALDSGLAQFVPPVSSIIDYIFTKVHVQLYCMSTSTQVFVVR